MVFLFNCTGYQDAGDSSGVVCILLDTAANVYGAAGYISQYK